jgi:hypothetical protein
MNLAFSLAFPFGPVGNATNQPGVSPGKHPETFADGPRSTRPKLFKNHPKSGSEFGPELDGESSFSHHFPHQNIDNTGKISPNHHGFIIILPMNIAFRKTEIQHRIRIVLSFPLRSTDVSRRFLVARPGHDDP